jgi:hypothetical protein
VEPADEELVTTVLEVEAHTAVYESYQYLDPMNVLCCRFKDKVQE